MKYVDEYRDPEAARAFAQALAKIVTRPWSIMEVCGGQTNTIMRFGLDEMLPAGVTLVHGPGCPVCVTPLELIDRALAIAAMPGVIFVSFGDMLRVPGTSGDLLGAKAKGADVRIVLSPLDAVKIARENPSRRVVFFGVGFETTAPATALAVAHADSGQVENFSLLVSHVLVPPAMEAILSSPANRVQGFLAAGHVCTVMGYTEYEPIAARYRVPIVVTGFEPLDILQGVLMCVKQLEEGRAEVENQYSRSVRRDGNPPARNLIREIFRDRPAQMARHRRDRRQRTRPPRPIQTLRRRIALRRLRHPDSRTGRVHQRARPSGPQDAARLPGIRDAMHAGAPDGRDHGVERRHVRGVPSPSPLGAPRGAMTDFAMSCPAPVPEHAHIQMAHGGGGRMMNTLIRTVFQPAFKNPLLATAHDGAVFAAPGRRLAFTTDSYVVRPLFFPGGDIGALAVNGTVNDLAMCGARPVALSAGFILEEGLPMETLRRVVLSMAEAAARAGVAVVTGDTKVVERGKGRRDLHQHVRSRRDRP